MLTELYVVAKLLSEFNGELVRFIFRFTISRPVFPLFQVMYFCCCFCFIGLNMNIFVTSLLNTDPVFLVQAR